MRRDSCVVAAVLAAFAIVCLTAASSDTVKVDGGTVAGISENGVRVFKGIPFAAPPIGALRWKAPQPPAAWSGVRQAAEFSAQCEQQPYPQTSIYYQPPRPTNEDCLYLNVWTTATAGGRRPVMVWIHGGALTRGTAATDSYDGANLARKGVIVVTTNYRLGVFGYLAHPGLTAESGHHASGNYGVLDQIAALEWVRRNIAAFGGDPAKVTIFGESAGSWSVNVLQASPLAKGLFRAVIGESGAQFGRNTRLKQAEDAGATFARAAGAASIDALRAVPAAKLLETQTPTAVNVDGWVLPDDVRTVFAGQRESKVPIIAGSNANEWTTLSAPATFPKTLDAYRTRMTAQFGPLAADADIAYPVRTDADIADAMLGMGRDTTFTLQMRTWARMNGKPAFLYQFAHVPPLLSGKSLGAYHASEITYVFNNVGKRPWATDLDRQIADQTSNYWVNFATTLDPNGKGLPKWTPYDAVAEPYLEIGDAIALKNHLLRPQLDFLQRALESRPTSRQDD